ncbi:hypothetical protein GCM10022402_22420 [Salinactinospora qingdaonensis]|uniref:Uncharacterized protein n=1 Tax=Salinactinospora qingdaonensis TaxID=702744 RepID=A0ABP7FL99_9ACTN
MNPDSGQAPLRISSRWAIASEAGVNVGGSPADPVIALPYRLQAAGGTTLFTRVLLATIGLAVAR